jgi:SpoVK/Ycf46/Vps4 family AAA+-type ATPase
MKGTNPLLTSSWGSMAEWRRSMGLPPLPPPTPAPAPAPTSAPPSPQGSTIQRTASPNGGPVSLRGSGQDSPPIQASLWHVTPLMFREASPDVKLTFGYERLSVRDELFGLDQCREILERQILTAPKYPAHYANPHTRPRQCSYLRGPDGCGLRTLVVNLCREWRVNLLHVNLPVQISPSRYQPGAFAEILQQAMHLQPCVVLLDRMDSYFSLQHFDQTGSELFTAWVNRNLHQQIDPPASVWIVITGILFNTEMPQGLSYYVDSAACQYLEPPQLVDVMKHQYAKWLLSSQIPDDRGPREALDDPHADHEAIQRRLEQSQFNQLLLAKDKVFRSVIQGAHERPWPNDVCRLINEAFHLSTARITAQMRSYPSAPPIQAMEALPTDEEITIAARRILPQPRQQQHPPPSPQSNSPHMGLRNSTRGGKHMEM